MANEETPPTDSRYAETYVNAPAQEAGGEFTKEQLDVALAAVTLQSGTLNERQLSGALARWTIHGSVTLVDHLGQEGLLTDSQRQRLLQQAAQRLSQSTDSLVGNGTASKSVLLGTLDAIDPSGTIARLMGIRGVAGAGAVDATGNRQASVRFRLVRKLGQGGLGRVWLAFDECLKRYVAVKEITAKDNVDALERFRREAEITGRLEHPGIVPIYQLGKDEQTGEVFYAMRFLGKTTMHDAIAEYHERRGSGDDDPMLIRRLLTDFVSICQAIGHAHSRKVIHRDLKPENIAIDSFGQVIVIDWGIAKVIDDVGEMDAMASANTASAGGSTMEGQVLGTPLYMAPEQAAGRIDELDERTDIYGLGAILFAILTGYAPHERTRDASGATTGRQLLAAITSRTTPHAHELNSDADPALAAICNKAMARKQYARYQSASQLADDVQRWMAGERVSAYRETTIQKIGRWIGRHRVWSQVIAAAVIVGVVALVTFAVTSWQERETHREMLFDDMQMYQREIEVQVQATSQQLAKDARFMSTLPPIQGLIDAGDGTVEGESEEIWRGRLETIYEGLLRANPNYLAISFVSVSGDDQAQSIVRVERNISDATYVRRVPVSRLGAFNHTSVFGKTVMLPPGEMLLAISEEGSSPALARQEVRLVAATPVYDERTGHLFGIVAVEANLLTRLAEVLESIDQRHAIICITDAAGDVWVREDPDVGVDVSPGKINLAEALPAAVDQATVSDRQLQLDRSRGWVGKRIALDPANPDAHVGVVVELKEGR